MSAYADQLWGWLYEPQRNLQERCRADSDVAWDVRLTEFLDELRLSAPDQHPVVYALTERVRQESDPIAFLSDNGFEQFVYGLVTEEAAAREESSPAAQPAQQPPGDPAAITDRSVVAIGLPAVRAMIAARPEVPPGEDLAASLAAVLAYRLTGHGQPAGTATSAALAGYVEQQVASNAGPAAEFRALFGQDVNTAYQWIFQRISAHATELAALAPVATGYRRDTGWHRSCRGGLRRPIRRSGRGHRNRGRFRGRDLPDAGTGRGIPARRARCRCTDSGPDQRCHSRGPCREPRRPVVTQAKGIGSMADILQELQSRVRESLNHTYMPADRFPPNFDPARLNAADKIKNWAFVGKTACQHLIKGISTDRPIGGWDAELLDKIVSRLARVEVAAANGLTEAQAAIKDFNEWKETREGEAAWAKFTELQEPLSAHANAVVVAQGKIKQYNDCSSMATAIAVARRKEFPNGPVSGIGTVIAGLVDSISNASWVGTSGPPKSHPVMDQLLAGVPEVEKWPVDVCGEVDAMIQYLVAHPDIAQVADIPKGALFSHAETWDDTTRKWKGRAACKNCEAWLDKIKANRA